MCAMNGCEVDRQYRAQYSRKIIRLCKQIALFHQRTVVEFFKLIYIKKTKKTKKQTVAISRLSDPSGSPGDPNNPLCLRLK